MAEEKNQLRNPWFTVSTLVYGAFVFWAVMIVVALAFGSTAQIRTLRARPAATRTGSPADAG